MSHDQSLEAIQARFERKLDKSGDCWLWLGAKTSRGYGSVTIGGRSLLAHRVSYEWANGPIPAGLVIDHKCHVESCVNPAHLRAVTPKQNIENLGGLVANNTSGVRGVSMHGCGKWLANVRHNGRLHHVGYFHDIKEAEAAVVAKRNELFTHNDLDRSTQ